MTRDEERRWIGDAVRRVYDEAGVDWPPAEGGPVPLHRLITDSRFCATNTEVDGLNRAAVAVHLRHWGVRWSGTADSDQKLAGFVFATGRAAHIFVRKGDYLPRRRFSAAHELGHLALHLGEGPEAELVHGDSEIVYSGAGSGDTATMERQANQFAAELLMPEANCRLAHERLAARYGPSLRFLVHQLASELLVSREAIAWRLYELGIAPPPGRRAAGDDGGADDDA